LSAANLYPFDAIVFEVLFKATLARPEETPNTPQDHPEMLAR